MFVIGFQNGIGFFFFVCRWMCLYYKVDGLSMGCNSFFCVLVSAVIAGWLAEAGCSVAYIVCVLLVSQWWLMRVLRRKGFQILEGKGSLVAYGGVCLGAEGLLPAFLV